MMPNLLNSYSPELHTLWGVKQKAVSNHIARIRRDHPELVMKLSNSYFITQATAETHRPGPRGNHSKRKKD